MAVSMNPDMIFGLEDFRDFLAKKENQIDPKLWLLDSKVSRAYSDAFIGVKKSRHYRIFPTLNERSFTLHEGAYFPPSSSPFWEL